MSWPSSAPSDPPPVVIRHAGRRWEVCPDAEGIVRSRAEWGFHALRREFAGHLLKDKPTRIVFGTRAAGAGVILKALRFDEFKVRLRSLFGRCRTRKEWENHRLAWLSGVPTVRPLALGECRRPLLVHEAVVILELRPDAETVTEWRRRGGGPANSEPALSLAAELGRLTARTHLLGMYHNEIKPDNLLIDHAGGGDRLLLIDWKHARTRPRSLENALGNLLRTSSLFDRDLPFAPPTEIERKAFLSAYVDALGNEAWREDLIARLKASCPGGRRE